MPKISVIIPVYNTERYLDKCLTSVINQSFKDIEIILINDGSTDNSYKILEDYEKKDSRIILVNQKNKGQGFARNLGIKLAKSPYLAFIDSDDFIKPTMLEDLYTIAKRDNADIVKSRYQRVTEDGKETKMVSTLIDSHSKEEFLHDILSLKYISIVWDSLFKKELFQDNVIKFPNIYFEDVAILYQLYFFAKKISYTNHVYYYWRERIGSTTQTFSEKHVNDIFKTFDITYKFLERWDVFDCYKNSFIIGCIKQFNKFYGRLAQNNFSLKDKKNLINKIEYFRNKSTYFSQKNIATLKEQNLQLYLMFYKNVNYFQSFVMTPNQVQEVQVELIEHLLQQHYRLSFLQQKVKPNSDLKKLHNSYLNKTCFIVGNGPSLSNKQKKLLQDKNIFYFSGNLSALEDIKSDSIFYVNDDFMTLSKIKAEIETFNFKYRFIPSSYSEVLIENSANIGLSENFEYKMFYSKMYQMSRFSEKVEEEIFLGETSMHLCTQLAYYMGFQTVYLIGIDLVFDSNKRINSALETDKSLKRIYSDFNLAKEVFEKDDRSIYNLSNNSILTMFKYKKKV